MHSIIAVSQWHTQLTNHDNLNTSPIAMCIKTVKYYFQLLTIIVQSMCPTDSHNYLLFYKTKDRQNIGTDETPTVFLTPVPV